MANICSGCGKQIPDDAKRLVSITVYGEKPADDKQVRKQMLTVFACGRKCGVKVLSKEGNRIPSKVN